MASDLHSLGVDVEQQQNSVSEASSSSRRAFGVGAFAGALALVGLAVVSLSFGHDGSSQQVQQDLAGAIRIDEAYAGYRVNRTETKDMLKDRKTQRYAKLIAEQMDEIVADVNFQEITRVVAQEMARASGATSPQIPVPDMASTSTIANPSASPLAAHIKSMMSDKDFMANVMRLASEYQAALAEPSFLQNAEQAAYQVASMSADPDFQTTLGQVAEQMAAKEDLPAKKQSLASRLFARRLFVSSPTSLASKPRSSPPQGLQRSVPAVSLDAVKQLESEKKLSSSFGEDSQDMRAISELGAGDWNPIEDSSPVAVEQQHFNPVAVATVLATLGGFPQEAYAKGGQYGIFEGRIVSLAHPTVMTLVYGASAYAGFTGWQWRQLRELGTELSEIKSQRKVLQDELKQLTPIVDPHHEDEHHEDEGGVQTLQLSPVKSKQIQVHEEKVAALTKKIDEITETRKELGKANLRDKHYQAGSIILGLGTAFAIEGPVNTFLRAQKLFPGPHLYAGAGVVVAWAMAASLVQPMQKGEDWARNAHIAFNVAAIGLFTWQIPTGLEITQKVIKFTKFP